jgi:hypothetical protein
MALLNETLAKKQKITDKQRDNLDILYIALEELVQRANDDEDIEKNAISYVEDMKTIEFNLQNNWNFPLDENYHTYWNTFAKCTCPIIDNIERFGQPKIIDTSCPFHGFEINVKIK